MHALAHIYRSHWLHLVKLQLHPHFNTLVFHMMLFSKQFDLVTAKDSSGVMEELFERLQRHHSHTVSLSECTITPTYDMTAVDEDSPFVEPPQQSFGNDPSASTAASS